MLTYVLAALACAALLMLAIVQAYRIVVGYRLATGTPAQKFLAAFSHSHTILLARIGSFSSAALAFGASWLPVLDPATQVGQAVQAVLSPKFTPYYLIGVFLLMEWLRRRPGSLDPITPPPQAVVIPPAPITIDPVLPSGAPNPVASE